jgi:hypothetical protein
LYRARGEREGGDQAGAVGQYDAAIAEFASDGSLQAISSADKAGQRQLLLTSGRAGARTAFINVEPPLGKYAAQAFADVLSVEWGLAKLALQDGVLDHDEVRIVIVPSRRLVISDVSAELETHSTRVVDSRDTAATQSLGKQEDKVCRMENGSGLYQEGSFFAAQCSLVLIRGSSGSRITFSRSVKQQS